MCAHRFVDLGEGAQVRTIEIWSRTDCCFDLFRDIEIRLGDADPAVPLNSRITSNKVIANYTGPSSGTAQVRQIAGVEVLSAQCTEEC